MKEEKFPFGALCFMLLFGGLQYYQLSKLLSGQADAVAIFWIVVNTVMIAGNVSKITIYTN